LFDVTVDEDEVQARITELLSLIEAEPNVLTHYFELKSIYSGYTRESEKGLKILEDALTRFPNDIELLIELAATYEFELEDFDQAKKYYERVLAIDPEHYLALDALEVINERSVHS
jgi:tetratricopeptide (TPR) repeat protein